MALLRTDRTDRTERTYMREGNMKAIRKWKQLAPVAGAVLAIAAIAMLAVSLQGCAGNGKPTPEDIKANAYKSLVVAAETYDASMKSVVTLAGRGMLKPSDVDRVKRYARIYYDAYQSASLALYTYAAISNEDAELKLSTALGQMSKALAEFIDIVKPYLEGGK